MLKIVITGGIASGKSFFLKKLTKSRLPVINADEEVAKFYKEPKFLCELSKVFQIEIKTKEDIKKIVLKEPFKLKILEKLIYKKLYQKFDNFEQKNRLKGYKKCLFEIPLVFEKNIFYKYDKIINVFSPVFLQKRRFLNRNKNNKEAEFYQFLSIQMHYLKKRYLVKKHKGMNVLNFKNINVTPF